MITIIRDYEEEAINQELDRFIRLYPEAKNERGEMYQSLVNTYFEYGKIATLRKKEIENE